MSDLKTRDEAGAPEWDQLGTDLVETIRRHYASFRDDVEQMRELVEDAIGKLVSAYHILQAQAKIGYEVMRGSREDDEEEGDETGVAQAGTSAALTALQFEDVLTQLLQRLRQRCDRFRPLPTTLVDSVLRSVQEMQEDADHVGALEEVRAELERVREDVDEGAERCIKQRSMDPGSVELF
ncbi:MAG: hypothetical protein QNJ98_09340 [Planctomycetota bacterium]|nr:hypothetical protein [Planctomycetota bacterium]